MSAEQSTFMLNKQKAEKLLKTGAIVFWIATIILAATFILRSCGKEYTEPVMAAEVSLPTLIKDENLNLGCQVEGEDCSAEELKKIDVESEIIKQANEYRVNVEEALAIAECESTFDIYAKNPKSTAKGVYQFTDPTWKWIKASGHQFDYKENIKQFMIWYQVYPGWWSECLAKTGL